MHFGFSSHNEVAASVAADVASPSEVLSDPTLASANKVADICPSCGASALVYEEGCVKCHACGHSEC